MSATWQHFLGGWQLIPQSCQYEQGAAPRAGRYRIEEQAGELVFTAHWIDQEGESHSVRFSGPPDGTKTPFAGGDLADALAVTAISPRELNSYAYFRGAELMVAQRQLDATLQHMRITQVVRLPDGTSPANVSIYARVYEN